MNGSYVSSSSSSSGSPRSSQHKAFHYWTGRRTTTTIMNSKTYIITTFVICSAITICILDQFQISIHNNMYYNNSNSYFTTTNRKVMHVVLPSSDAVYTTTTPAPMNTVTTTSPPTTSIPISVTSHDTITNEPITVPLPLPSPTTTSIPSLSSLTTNENQTQKNVSLLTYQEQVRYVNQSTASIQCMKFRQELNIKYIPNMESVISCLQHTYDQQQHQQQHPIINWNNVTTTTNQTQQQQPYFNVSLLQYPVDAEIHYNNIRYAMASYAQDKNHTMHTAAGYSGPWIENIFISHFESLYDNITMMTTQQQQQQQEQVTCLNEIFGPYIPLFIPWVDHFVNYNRIYPVGMIDTLKSVLRHDVAYITVSQNADGLNDNELLHEFPNIIIVAAGGHGHIPVPLLKQSEIYDTQKIPMNQRPIDISYAGSLGNAPYESRQKMHKELVQQLNSIDINTTKQLVYNYTTTSTILDLPIPKINNHNNTNNTTDDNKLKNYTYAYYYGKDWRTIMKLSKYSLVPRGYGRTAYHLVEAIQLGYIPIYIYLDNDVPWIPYYNTIYHPYIGYETTFQQLPNLLLQLFRNNTDSDLEQREKNIQSYYKSHYTFDAIMEQIQSFMLLSNTVLSKRIGRLTTRTSTSTSTSTSTHKSHTISDLQCQKLPLFARVPP